MSILVRKNIMKMLAVSGSALAAAAATLLLAGAASAPSYAASDAVGHCVGANSCKGTSACKTASNACKGQNTCKGQGFLALSKAECDKIEGAKFEPAK
jgi:hypothetical protein